MIEPSRETVGNVPVKLVDAGGADSTGGASAVLIPVTGTAPIFLGGDDTVSAANGAQWDPALGPLSVTLQPGEEIWAIRSSADQDIHVLAFGK